MSNSIESPHLRSDQLRTPTAMKSRTTSMGDPGHANFKNNPLQLAVNDSISSNKTRPSQDKNDGMDQSAIRMVAPGQGILSLIDNREVSPAPVSHFAPKTLGINRMGHNRVTLPFKRRFSGLEDGPVFDKLSLKRAATQSWQENFKFSSSNPNENISKPGNLKVSLR